MQYFRADGSTLSMPTLANGNTGQWKWRLSSNYPIVGGITPIAGGFGDVGGNFYAVDALSSEKLWGQQMGGPIAGGVITYTVNGAQKVAVTTGLVSPAWPVKIASAKIAILGIEGEMRNRE